LNNRIFFSDPVLGTIFFDGRECNLIQTAELTRLRYIYQLATAYIFFPFAIHSRFHHSIGVASLIKQFISSLPLKMYEKYIREREILTISALLHDIGHSAWGHAGEVFVKFINKQIDHEKISVDLILNGKKFDKYFNDWDLPRISDVIDTELAELITKPILGQPLFIDIEEFRSLSEEDKETMEKKRRFLSQLIKYYIDFDRVEYLLRDISNTGNFNVPFGIGGIFQNLGIEKVHGINQLCFLNRNFGENFVLAREAMYASVYNDSRVLLSEEMLGRAWVDLYFSDTINKDLYRLWFSTDFQIFELLRNSEESFPKRVYNLLRSCRIYEMIEHRFFSDLDENLRQKLRIINHNRSQILKMEEDCTDSICDKRDLIIGIFVKKPPKEMEAFFLDTEKKLRKLSESELIKPLALENFVNQRSKFIIGVNEELSRDKKDKLKRLVYEYLDSL